MADFSHRLRELKEDENFMFRKEFEVMVLLR